MLVFAAILIKVTAATVCMLDGPRVAASATTVGVSQAMETQSVDDQDDDCLLGENGGCHCACAHAMTLPAVTPGVALAILPLSVEPHRPVAPSLRPVASPLRPPIA